MVQENEYSDESMSKVSSHNQFFFQLLLYVLLSTNLIHVVLFLLKIFTKSENFANKCL